MVTQEISRRTLLKGGGAAVAGLTALQVAGPARAFPGHGADAVLPWLDQPAPNPVPQIAQNLLVWEELDSWITPADDFFVISHYGNPALDGASHRLAIGGLVARPRTLTLADLKAPPPPRRDLHDGVLGEHGPAVPDRRRRQCALGGDAAGSAPRARGDPR